MSNDNGSQASAPAQTASSTINKPVFFISAALVFLFAGLSLLFPEQANKNLFASKDWAIENFDWFFSLTPLLLIVLAVIIVCSPMGRIKLGGPDAKTEFSRASWLSMLFAAGIGIGFMFYGGAEPLAYYTDWYGTPFNLEAGNEELRELAFTATIFHWGFVGWSIYAIMGLSLGYFAYNKGLPLTIRSAFHPLLGDRIWGWPGHIIDILAVIATIFGLATSIGIGATQAASGIGYMTGTPASLGLQILLIAVIMFVATLSVLRGLNGGVKLLSNINMVVAFGLLVFVIITGPTTAIFKGWAENTVNLIRDTPRLTNWIGREDTTFFHGWTIFYWAWWMAWSPFVGMFIARISKGRSLREYLVCAMIVPTLIGIIWFTAFGETAISQYESGSGELKDGVGDASLVLFQMLGGMPFTLITSIIGLVLLVIFIVTSADSGALVVDSLTSGKTDAPKRQRVFWVGAVGVTSAALLYGGGADTLKALQAGTITAALPFTFIVLACGLSLFIALRHELKKTND